mmetsp:Transcript_101877/g.297086  ORF Transcript_101877/g.297086 Transcript_101877/m.297086 type:complete len:279 (-) Transcript_101877:951-1787(-)
MITFALSLGGGSRLMVSPFVAQSLEAPAPCRPPPADGTRGSEGAAPSGPGLPARPLLPTLAPAWLPSSFPPESPEELMVSVLLSRAFDLRAGMLRGRTGRCLVAILSRWASEDVLFDMFLSSAFIRLIWQGETHVVESSLSHSSAGSFSTQIFLRSSSCRTFLAFSSLAFLSRFCAFMWLNFATAVTEALLFSFSPVDFLVVVDFGERLRPASLPSSSLESRSLKETLGRRDMFNSTEPGGSVSWPVPVRPRETGVPGHESSGCTSGRSSSSSMSPRM